MASKLDALVIRLQAHEGPARVAAIAGYPRDAHTGLLPGVGVAIETIEAQLGTIRVPTYRVLHGITVAVAPVSIDLFTVLKHACRQACTSEIEVRSLVVTISGARDPRWLDELIGDLSLRSNFGTFSEGSPQRLIDGREA